MPHTERSSCTTNLARDDAYEEVRQSFRTRLRAEQARLTTLTELLRSAAGNPATAFGDLEAFAHRLRGAAAVFDYPELRDVAKALEMAASAAIALRSRNCDLLVLNAIRALDTRLTSLNGGVPAN